MEDYIRDAVNASGDEMLLEAYDKEWALTDLGKHEGFKEGIQEGIEQTQVQVVIDMLKENLDVDLISKVTKLSVEEINTIKEKNN